jgi:hypothetical protein
MILSMTIMMMTMSTTTMAFTTLIVPVPAVQRRTCFMSPSKRSGRYTKLQLSLLSQQQQQLYQSIQSIILFQSVYMKPAAEHTQPFWGGSLDPYLTAGKSIAPSSKALSELGITTINDKSNAIAVFGEKITSDNKFIIDGTHIQMEDVLPGFTKTGGILSQHTTFDATPPPSVVSFVASIDWASKFINVIDKLPIAVLVYVLIEFFLLRPNINTYKEDIEEDPTGIFADTMAVATVRVTMFCIVAIATVGVFG